MIEKFQFNWTWYYWLTVNKKSSALYLQFICTVQSGFIWVLLVLCFLVPVDRWSTVTCNKFKCIKHLESSKFIHNLPVVVWVFCPSSLMGTKLTWFNGTEEMAESEREKDDDDDNDEIKMKARDEKSHFACIISLSSFWVFRFISLFLEGANAFYGNFDRIQIRIFYELLSIYLINFIQISRLQFKKHWAIHFLSFDQRKVETNVILVSSHI